MTVEERLSVPPHPRRPPRVITDGERTALLEVADSLIPGMADLPAPSRTPEIREWLDRALAARTDVFHDVVELAARLAALDSGEREAELRRLYAEAPEEFARLASVLAGAYLMAPAVRKTIGYPGQERSHPAFDEAADEIMDGILDPVIARGPIYVAPPDLGRPSERAMPAPTSDRASSRTKP